MGLGFLMSAIGLVRMANGRRGLIPAIAGFVLALFSKEAALVLPFVLAALMIAIPHGGRVLRNRLLWVAWMATACTWSFLRPVAEGQANSLADRFSVAVSYAHVVLVHLGKLLVPSQLAVLAYARDTTWVIGAWSLVPLVAVAVWLRDRRFFLWGLGCFLAFVLPTLPVSDFLILENRLYVPAIGIVVSVVAAGAEVAERRPRSRPLVAGLASCALVAFAILTIRYAESFHDPERFTSQAIRSSPSLGLAHLNRGIVFHVAGRAAEAEAEYRQALALDSQIAVTHNNLGLV
jgi:hypothetical protein